MSYRLWQLLPFAVTYPDGTQATFEFDEAQRVSRVTERTGVSFQRQSELDAAGFAPFAESGGLIARLSFIVAADGTYQRREPNGAVHTVTTDGRKLVSYPFEPGFDLKRTLVRIFKQIDRSADGALTKDELNEAVLRHWGSADEAQLVAMLKLHYDMIWLTRDKALFRLTQGITIADILRFDQITTGEQRKHQEPPQQLLQTVEDLFARVDINSDGMTTIDELAAARGRGDLSKSQEEILGQILSHIGRVNSFDKSGYVDRSHWLYKKDLLALFKGIYFDEVGSRLVTGGWGLEEHWQKVAGASRSLYGDAKDPLDSIKLSAIKQGGVGDCLFLAALGSVIVAHPQIVLKTIRDNANGTYAVTFAGASDEPITLDPPTQVELALYARGSEFGIWAPLIEKAYGLYLASHGRKRSIIPAENTGGARENCRSFDLLTGQTGSWRYTSVTSKVEMRRRLTESFKQRRAVACGVLGYSDRKVGDIALVSNHAYSVIAWSEKDDEITLRNPWGFIAHDASRNENPRGSFDDGTNGVFSLKFLDFYDNVQVVYFEEWLP